MAGDQFQGAESKCTGLWFFPGLDSFADPSVGQSAFPEAFERDGDILRGSVFEIQFEGTRFACQGRRALFHVLDWDAEKNLRRLLERFDFFQIRSKARGSFDRDGLAELACAAADPVGDLPSVRHLLGPGQNHGHLIRADRKVGDQGEIVEGRLATVVVPGRDDRGEDTRVRRVADGQ